MEFSIKNIEEARSRIKDYIIETPLLRLEALDKYLGCQVYVKLENMQKIGAFKFRGAMNKIQSLTDEDLAKGIVAASSGNHGKAIAYGAKMKGTKATIIMPRTAPAMKIEAIKALGAEVILCDAEERFEVAAKVCEETGGTMVPPYDDYEVMAGQGTLGLEIMEQCPDVDVVVVPASGGGLIGGVATALKGVAATRSAVASQGVAAAAQSQAASQGVTATPLKVYGAEPSVLPRYSESIKFGEPTTVPMPEQKSVADALVSNRPGLKCFPVVCDHVDGFAAVDDIYMLKAMKMLLMEGKILAEPSSCIGMGAVLQGKIAVKQEEKVCFVISGGNLGFEQLELLGGVEY